MRGLAYERNALIRIVRSAVYDHKHVRRRAFELGILGMVDAIIESRKS